jgi:hypothetical protein
MPRFSGSTHPSSGWTPTDPATQPPFLKYTRTSTASCGTGCAPPPRQPSGHWSRVMYHICTHVDQEYLAYIWRYVQPSRSETEQAGDELFE